MLSAFKTHAIFKFLHVETKTVNSALLTLSITGNCMHFKRVFLLLIEILFVEFCLLIWLLLFVFSGVFGGGVLHIALPSLAWNLPSRSG